MRIDRLVIFRWSALFALALFVLSSTPHDHDVDECIDGTCLPCYVQGIPLIDSTDRSGVHDTPDESVRQTLFEESLDHPRNAVIHGKDSRAPPA